MRTSWIKGKLLAICVLAFGLAGCVTVPNKNLDRGASTNVRTIAVLNIAEPKSEQVQNLGGGAAMFGLIGGLVQGSINQSHSDTYSDMAARQNVQFSPDLVRAITGALTAGGYNVEYLSNQKPLLDSDGKSDDFSSIHTTADAILVVWFTSVGYISPPSMSGFEPWVVVKAKLLDSKTKAELYNRTFSAGYEMAAKGSIHISASGAYQYDSFDSLKSAFDDSIRGLKLSMGDIAAYIGRDLARGTAPGVLLATTSTPALAGPATNVQQPVIVGSASTQAYPAATSPQVYAPAAVTASPSIVRQPQSPKSVVLTQEDTGPKVTLTQAAELHSRPIQAAPVVTTLPAGAEIKQTSGIVSNESGNWCYVMFGKVQGWMLTSALPR